MKLPYKYTSTLRAKRMKQDRQCKCTKQYWSLFSLKANSSYIHNECYIHVALYYTYYCLNKNLNASIDLLTIPLSGGKMSKRLGGIIGCKYKTSSWHLNGFPDGSSNIGSTVYNTREKPIVMLCVCVCVFFPFILDIKFVGRTSRGHTGGRSHRISHPPSFCGACALIFLARRIQPFLSLVDREVEFCVLTI